MRQAESAISKAQTQRLSTLPNEGLTNFVFETRFNYLEADKDNLEQWLTTGIALTVATLFSASTEPAKTEWPAVTFFKC